MNNGNETIIKTDKLTRQFGRVVAVNNLDLEIKQGEIFGLVGPDGAGKTTTMRMLSAIMDPTTGSATIAGFDLRQQPELIKEHIGYMAQQFALYGDLTVLENINFFADVFGVRGKKRQERTERLLEFARLTEFTNRPAGRLSGGMKKKLGLACALIHERIFSTWTNRPPALIRSRGGSSGTFWPTCTWKAPAFWSVRPIWMRPSAVRRSA